MIDRITLIEGKKYDFLRNNEDLKNVCYLTLSGSHGYGTNINSSDIDLRGVLLENPKYLLGLKSFEQFEDLTTDTVIYGLKKFVSLCTNANPNALELLGTNIEDVIIINEAGSILRNNANLFLSKRVITSFGEYASAQLKRLKNALCHDVYDKEEQSKHLAETLMGQIRHFNDTYKSFEKNSMSFYISEINGEYQILFDVTLKGYPVKDFFGIYSEVNSTVKAYNKLNHRNRKKNEPHLFKHAMHLIRLLLTGIDILNREGIITKRENELSLLMDIRNGKYTFDEIFNITKEYQIKFEEVSKKTLLPEKPNMDKIEELMVKLWQTNGLKFRSMN